MAWMWPPWLAWLGVLLGGCHAWQYGIVVDAGSGGSRFHFFRWPDRLADPLHPQYPAISIPEEQFAVKVVPGISAFRDNVSGLDAYLDRLLGMALARMQSLREIWSLIPIYLKATAGARDLFQDQRDRIFASIRAYLYRCPFRFETDYWARTISGEEEGVFGWLSVNMMKGTFRSKHIEDTWGSLDMGGASAQVTFIPHDVSIIQNFYPMHMSYLSIHLYAHSFLEFGYNDANMRIVRLLLQEGQLGTEEHPLLHPCFPINHTFTQPLRQPFFIERDSVWMRGTGDLSKCMRLALSLLDLNKPCFVPARSHNFERNRSFAGACSISGTYEPPLYSQKFIAMGHYSKIAAHMGLPLETAVPLGEWLRGTQRLCAASPSVLEHEEEEQEQEHPHGQRDPIRTPIARCWKAVWFWTVLHWGFRFPENSTQIVFAHTLEGRELGWALGSMANDVNYYPWSDRPAAAELAQADLAAGVGFGVASVGPAAGVVAALVVTSSVLSLVLGAALGARWAQCRRSMQHMPIDYCAF